MATYQREDLVRSVLFELGVLDANEAPEAEDAEVVNDTAQQVIEGLYEDGLIPFDLDGVIPARYFRSLVRVIAPELSATYGTAERANLLEGNKIDAMRQLQKLRQKADLSVPTQATYF